MNNNKTMEVSLLDNITSMQPRPGTLEQIASLISSDERIKTYTASYRQTKLKTFKSECPLFAVACRFSGGKSRQHVTALTGLSLVDFDHVAPGDPAALASLKRKAADDPHTLMCYTTISGQGLRVIYRYELPAAPLPPPERNYGPAASLYASAFVTGNAYYERLLGVEADAQCKNITRLSGLAHDPDVFLRPEAEAVPFSLQEMDATAAGHARQRKEDRLQRSIQDYFDMFIAPQLAKEGIVYQPGSHNEYVMRTGYKLAERRFARKSVLQWAGRRFADYADTAQVITSCFANARGGRSDDGGGKDGGWASVDEIKAFLDSHVQLRYNVISGRVECEEDGEWTPLSDRRVNSLWAEMSLTTRVFRQDLFNIIESDYVRDYHPFREYLDSLPPVDAGDPIRRLAETVVVKGGDDEQELWYQYLLKWMVAMVAGWVSEDTVNNVMLVLIGEQGSFKTTWFNCLLPPELRRYFYTKTNAKRMSKDDLIVLSQYGLVCCEELDTMSLSELNQLKAAMTMPSIDERAAYARFHEHRKHIASFCGTGNNPQFLSDTTGNRRWLPFEVERILSPREHPFDHRAIYAQAKALYDGGFRFWFVKADIVDLNKHNCRFETPRLELELVDLYFRKPGPSETGIFVTATRALQIIGGGISQKLTPAYVGRAFIELGFKRVRSGDAYGYIVVERTGEEMKAYQKRRAMDAEPEES